ncbi:MAG: hypothetical protein JHC95_04675 [Solirubrobacteraceae bacterium]|nr:hypothetical protein [Solirubrobacteraceae bacterium]
MNQRERTRGLTVDAGLVCAAALGSIVTTALVVTALGLGPEARRTLALEFAGLPRTRSEAICIATHNGAIAAAPLLAAAAVAHVGPRGRRAIVVALWTLLVVNSVAVGIVVGAYGRRALTALAPHGPLELLAFSVAGGACMQACRQRVGIAALVGVATFTMLTLAAAAVLEVYVPTQGADR